MTLEKWGEISQGQPCKVQGRSEDYMLRVRRDKYLLRDQKGSKLEWLVFSSSVVSNTLRPHGLQHARIPCPSLSPGICSDSCPLSQ